MLSKKKNKKPSATIYVKREGENMHVYLPLYAATLSGAYTLRMQVWGTGVEQ